MSRWHLAQTLYSALKLMLHLTLSSSLCLSLPLSLSHTLSASLCLSPCGPLIDRILDCVIGKFDFSHSDQFDQRKVIEQLQAGGALQTIQVFSSTAQAAAAGAVVASPCQPSEHIEAKVAATAAALRRVKDVQDQSPSPQRPLSRKSCRLGQVRFCCSPVPCS